MRFYEYLKEVFNLNVPIKIWDNNSTMFQATFFADNEEFGFKCDYFEDSDDWSVVFGDADDLGSIPALNHEPKNEFWSGIRKCFEEFLKSQKPKAFWFTTVSPALKVKLYSKPFFQRWVESNTKYKLNRPVEENRWRYSK
jgi:hypothetical protein